MPSRNEPLTILDVLAAGIVLLTPRQRRELDRIMEAEQSPVAMLVLAASYLDDKLGADEIRRMLRFMRRSDA